MERIAGKNGTYLNLYPGSGYDPTVFERPTLTVDICIFRLFEQKLQILMIRRAHDPFAGKLAFPGGFVDIKDGESSDDAAVRELEEETGIARGTVKVRQFKTYASAARDPRWYTTDIVYYCLLHESQWRKIAIQAGDDAAEAYWVDVDEALLGELAFDHSQILSELREHLRDPWNYFHLRSLGANSEGQFHFRDMVQAYSALTGKHVHISNMVKFFRARFNFEPAGPRGRGYVFTDA